MTISTPDHGATLNLQWGASCGTAAIDDAVYEGTIGSWCSHVPGAGNRYYLVVPVAPAAEGICGHASTGAPIPASSLPCRAILNGTPCP